MDPLEVAQFFLHTVPLQEFDDEVLAIVVKQFRNNESSEEIALAYLQHGPGQELISQYIALAEKLHENMVFSSSLS